MGLRQDWSNGKMEPNKAHLTRALINLGNLTHNMNLLQDHIGKRPLWPAVKANAYGHGAEIIARHLINMGHTTLCVDLVGAEHLAFGQLGHKKSSIIFF